MPTQDLLTSLKRKLDFQPLIYYYLPYFLQFWVYFSLIILLEAPLCKSNWVFIISRVMRVTDRDPPGTLAHTTLWFVFFFSMTYFNRSLLQLPAGKCDQSPADGVNAAVRFWGALLPRSSVFSPRFVKEKTTKMKICESKINTDKIVQQKWAQTGAIQVSKDIKQSSQHSGRIWMNLRFGIHRKINEGSRCVYNWLENNFPALNTLVWNLPANVTHASIVYVCF